MQRSPTNANQSLLRETHVGIDAVLLFNGVCGRIVEMEVCVMRTAV
jgi:hypothetical protein